MFQSTWALIFLFPLVISARWIDRSLDFVSIDCGATSAYTDPDTGLKWIPDDPFVEAGRKSTLPNGNSSAKILDTVRIFPDSSNGNGYKKYCYVLPVRRGRRYLVRSSYYYGSFDGGRSPPVFDQIVGGTIWSTVNTTADYSFNLYTYYEIIVQSTGKSLSVCLAPNAWTVGNPFISALELRLLHPSMYNTTNFESYALSTVARHNFGYSQQKVIRYPDDPYDRFWEPFVDSNRKITVRFNNISVRDLWNKPPLKIFQNALTTDDPALMEIQWPPNRILVKSSYYIALYFQDINISKKRRDRVFNISVNGKKFYSMLNVSAIALDVYTSEWPLSGLTKLVLDPVAESKVGPIINAGEIFQLVRLGGRTLTRDVTALIEMKKNLMNVPSDWEGDPCLPRGYSWTGITCTEGKRTRVVILNLTSAGLTGSLSPDIANLTALTDIWLGGNNLSGTIPNFSTLRRLSTLHLENNELSGKIPKSLAENNKLSELFLQNNNLSGQIPEGLRKKPGLDIRLSPGNHLLVKPSQPTSVSPRLPKNDCDRRSSFDLAIIFGVGLITLVLIL